MLDLLLGARKHRYLGRGLADLRPAEVYVRGFSAGSYSGICLLHLLWNMPHVQVGGILGGISCPPALLHGILPEHGDRLMLIHLTTDRLCQWHPYDKTLNSLNWSNARVRKQARESGQASWPATNARVSRQQTRESADNKRASQAKKKNDP